MPQSSYSRIPVISSNSMRRPVAIYSSHSNLVVIFKLYHNCHSHQSHYTHRLSFNILKLNQYNRYIKIYCKIAVISKESQRILILILQTCRHLTVIWQLSYYHLSNIKVMSHSSHSNFKVNLYLIQFSII